MKLTIKINMDNAVFCDNLDELTDILRTIGNKILGRYQYGELQGKVRDSNGNTVGGYKIVNR